MSIRSLIFDHIWLKFFSVVLATLIWLAVRANLNSEPLLPHKFGAENTQTFMNCPILVLSDGGNHAAVALSPDRATVTVNGPSTLMQGLKDKDLNVFVRLNEQQPSTLELPVHVYVPPGARVVVVTPVAVNVKTLKATPPPSIQTP